MRIAVLSDIHANLEALDAVLADVRDQGAEEIYCLGDVIGYGADPVACLERVRAACRIRLRGNHEAALLDPAWLARMNPEAAAALRWTAGRLSAADREEIAAWPLVRVGADARLVHGSPFEPAEFHYLRGRLDLESAFRAFGERLCLCGHSHVPLAAEEVVPGVHRLLPATGGMDLEEDKRYLVNVGSVGQPRGGTPQASWALITDQPPRVDLRLVDYPYAEAQAKIRAAGLPESLAARLADGW
jgi:diadenosine tetraphosphatase ApaH/serine/threonine PP2A family protein phosphatase